MPHCTNIFVGVCVAAAPPPVPDQNPHITKALKELSAIYSLLSDRHRVFTLSKAATAVSMHPHKIRTREDALAVQRLPGGGSSRSGKEGSTVDKVNGVGLLPVCAWDAGQRSCDSPVQIVELATTGRLERLETLKKDPKIATILTFGKVRAHFTLSDTTTDAVAVCRCRFGVWDPSPPTSCTRRGFTPLRCGAQAMCMLPRN